MGTAGPPGYESWVSDELGQAEYGFSPTSIQFRQVVTQVAHQTGRRHKWSVIETSVQPRASFISMKESVFSSY